MAWQKPAEFPRVQGEIQGLCGAGCLLCVLSGNVVRGVCGQGPTPLSLLPAEVGSGGLLLAWHVPEEYQGMKTLGAQADSFSR